MLAGVGVIVTAVDGVGVVGVSVGSIAFVERGVCHLVHEGRW